MKVFSELTNLIFQRKCAICSEINTQLSLELGICSLCSRGLQSRRNIVNRGSLRIFAGSEFSPKISHIILAAKEENNKFARAILAEYLTTALNLATSAEKIVLIPIPSRKAADRKRGFAHVIKLINCLEDRNRDRQFIVIDALRHTRKIKDQSTLNINERELNMSGAFGIDNRASGRIKEIDIANSPIYLVDDLVTTGSTIRAANSALISLRVGIKGVLASCATNGFTH
ncbi:ComFC Predicted amidophosphoribosyltransferases [actinobacterium SCGC AAA044-D11]